MKLLLTREYYVGIVSSIAFCSDYSGLFAASSLSGAVTLFSEATGEDPIAFLDGIKSAITQVHTNGYVVLFHLTTLQVKFNPLQPHLLYASQRRSDDILCWDVREPFEVLRRFKRSASSTNQKLMFDIDPTGRWLASGDDVCYFRCSLDERRIALTLPPFQRQGISRCLMSKTPLLTLRSSSKPTMVSKICKALVD